MAAPTHPINDCLLALLGRRLNDAARTWFEHALETAAAEDVSLLLGTYTGASLRVGRAPLALGEAERAEAGAAGIDLPLDRWTLEDVARAALLLTRVGVASSAGAFVADATACYESGDAREQQSWLRAVSLLPQAERFLPLVIDACRTNILPLFEAIACENPYPERFFPELNFNQMVLKALFNNVALARIIGLSARRNPELSRMAADYASERRAAGRSVPVDIGLAQL